MEKTGLHLNGEIRVVFLVQQYDATCAFYGQVLGLSILDEWGREDGNRGVIYQIGNTQLEILESRDEPQSEGFYIYIEVDDVDALHERLSKVTDIVDAIGDRPWKHRNFSIKDPNGFKLKFFSKL